jgi:hypothetical protein
MATRYSVYRPFGDILTQVTRRQLRISKQKAVGLREQLISDCMHDPSFCMSINAAVLVDEFEWERRGHPIYFVQDESLVHMLWKAKMALEVEDLGELPKSFVVAWPKGIVVNGQKLRSFLVTICSRNERQVTADRFGDKYLDSQHAELVSPPGEKLVDNDAICLHMAYSDIGEQSAQRAAFYRFSMPGKFVSDCLKSSEDMHETLGTYGKGLIPYSLPLNADDWKTQYTYAKLVTHLLVYMRACPDAVRQGWPDQFKPRDISGPWKRQAKPTGIGLPTGFRQSHGHGSPEPHWRTWYFRRHPRRRDGTRKSGPVFVHGTVVGREVDPHTVIEKKRRR